MGGGAPELVESPLGRLVLIGLGGCLSFCFLWACDRFWRHTLGPLFVKLGHVGFGGVFGHGAVYPLHFLITADADVRRWIAHGMAASERAVVNMIGSVIWFAYDLGFTLVKVAYDLNSAVDSIGHHARRVVPQRLSAQVERRLTHLRAQEAALEQRVGRLEHAKRTVGAAAGAQDWERLNRGIDRLNREVTQLQHREHALEGARSGGRTQVLPRTRAPAHAWQDVLAKPAAVALVAAALGSFGANFLRCAAWQRAFRRISCGWGSLLESILAAELDVLLLRDLCRVVGIIESIAIRFEPVLLNLIDEIEGFVCGGEKVSPSGIVAADFQRVAALPSGIVAADLEAPAPQRIAA